VEVLFEVFDFDFAGASVTVMVALALFFPALAVMVTVPFFTAWTRPSGPTVAT
jgi:hypothetical protein